MLPTYDYATGDSNLGLMSSCIWNITKTFSSFQVLVLLVNIVRKFGCKRNKNCGLREVSPIL